MQLLDCLFGCASDLCYSSYMSCGNRSPWITIACVCLQIKLFKDDSTASARSWRLPVEAGLGSTTGSTSVETALAEAKQQLNCWEEDVMALQFVAGHESLEDIADLDVTYNNSHLEVCRALAMLAFTRSVSNCTSTFCSELSCAGSHSQTLPDKLPQ